MEDPTARARQGSVRYETFEKQATFPIFYFTMIFFKKFSEPSKKKLRGTGRLSRLISHFEPHGTHDRCNSRGRRTFTGPDLGFYPTAFGMIFIPLYTLKTA
ncbi:hypothetical protein DESC_140043 [Desulfosarcina cetonica]|nr:hypothetical protein DESC_140043 [Desulfosarcina cetonica]